MQGVRLKTHGTAVGEPNEMEVFLGQPLTSQPSGSVSKLVDNGHFLDDTFPQELDMRTVEDVGAAFIDSLGDASLDNFTDLSCILMEPSLMGQPAVREEEEDSVPLPFLSLEVAIKCQQQSLKRTFAEMQEPPSDLQRLSASVGLAGSPTPSPDHDYSAKRPRLSRSPIPTTVESAEETFLVPDVSLAASPSPVVSAASEDAKRKQRRDKNNLASKRSREIRKKKFINMEVEAERLTQENARLERQVEQLQTLAKDMKEVLVTKLKINKT